MWKMQVFCQNVIQLTHRRNTDMMLYSLFYFLLYSRLTL